MTLTDMIGQELPYDGAHDANTVADAALGIAALVRYLNNATGPWNVARTLQHAPTVYDVLGGIDAVAHGFDQLLTQLADALTRQAHDPTMYDDRRDRQASLTATKAADHLNDARDAAWPLTAALTAARGLTAHLGHDLDAGEGER